MTIDRDNDEEIQPSGLTGKQEKFAQEYVKDYNGTRAAKAAGYSEHTAAVIASENLRKPNIKAYIDEIQKDLAQLAGVSPLMIVNELKKIAFSSIAHLHNTWIERVEFETLTDDQKAAIEVIDTKVETRTIKINEGSDIDTETHYVKVKLFDKLKAMEMISKQLGFNSPEKVSLKHELPGDATINLIVKASGVPLADKEEDTDGRIKKDENETGT